MNFVLFDHLSIPLLIVNTNTDLRSPVSKEFKDFGPIVYNDCDRISRQDKILQTGQTTDVSHLENLKKIGMNTFFSGMVQS